MSDRISPRLSISSVVLAALLATAPSTVQGQVSLRSWVEHPGIESPGILDGLPAMQGGTPFDLDLDGVPELLVPAALGVQSWKLEPGGRWLEFSGELALPGVVYAFGASQDDIVVITYSGGTSMDLHLVTRAPTGVGLQIASSTPFSGLTGAVAVVDLDLDGDADIIGQALTNWPYAVLVAVLRQGTDWIPVQFPGTFPIDDFGIKVAQVTGGPTPEVLMPIPGYDGYQVLELDLSAVTATAVAVLPAPDMGDAAVLDVDDDGLSDIVCGSGLSLLHYRQVAPGTFALAATFPVPSPLNILSAVDFDEDGWMDVVGSGFAFFSSGGPRTCYLLENVSRGYER